MVSKGKTPEQKEYPRTEGFSEVKAGKVDLVRIRILKEVHCPILNQRARRGG